MGIIYRNMTSLSGYFSPQFFLFECRLTQKFQLIQNTSCFSKHLNFFQYVSLAHQTSSHSLNLFILTQKLKLIQNTSHFSEHQHFFHLLSKFPFVIWTSSFLPTNFSLFRTLPAFLNISISSNLFHLLSKFPLVLWTSSCPPMFNLKKEFSSSVSLHIFICFLHRTFSPSKKLLSCSLYFLCKSTCNTSTLWINMRYKKGS